MRPIHLTRLDKTRPAVILTRAGARSSMTSWTVAPITTRIRGLDSEVPVGRAHGLDRDSVINCDNLRTVPHTDIGRQIGFLQLDDEIRLMRALVNAFDLAVDELP